jgi:hypothetical protein
MKNKFLPLAIVIILCAIIIPLLMDGDDGKYIVSYEGIKTPDPYRPSKVKLYIENSGSMDGYMFAGSELKDAVYSYVGGLANHADTTELYSVNSDIYRINSTLNDVIYAMSPATFHKSLGNKANTDIAQIFNMVLSQIENNSISVLITDGILDLPAGSSEFFLTKQTQIKSIFVNYLKSNPNFSIEIFRLTSRFNGNYYYTGGCVALTNQPRPYYMFVLGDKQTLSVAKAIISNGQIQHGVDNYYAYSSYTQVPFVVQNKKKKGKDGDFEVRLQKKEVPITVKANMQYTLHEDEVLQNSKCYTIAFGDERIKIKSIKQLTKEPDYTHAFTITLPPEADESCVNMYFIPRPYPLWLDDANTDLSDASVATSMKTTGIKYIVEGISDAFASTCVNNPAAFTNESKVFAPTLDNKPIPVLAGLKFRIDKKAHFEKPQKTKSKNNRKQ